MTSTTSNSFIPLSIPNLAGNEWNYIKECLDTNWVSSVGSYVTLFENKVAEFTGAKYAVATSNGTAALHICLMLAGVKENDFVIVPNITFIASANSIKYTGASPLLIDIEEDTWQMDLNLLEEFLQNKTTQNEKGECIHQESGRRIKAIMPVHVLGNMGNIERLVTIAEKYHLQVVEDATESLGSYYNGKHSGTFGIMGCFSFNGNKIITTGGGGMIVTNDEVLAKKAKHLTTQAKISNIEYIHDEVGYNYRLVNLLAAMGAAQMELLPSFLQKKKEIRKFYMEKLSDIEGIKFQVVPQEADVNYWLLTIRIPNMRNLLQHLISNKIEARPFWMPMNQLEMFKNEIYYTQKNISDRIYQDCISLPCSTNITEAEMQRVIDCLRELYI